MNMLFYMAKGTWQGVVLGSWGGGTVTTTGAYEREAGRLESERCERKSKSQGYEDIRLPALEVKGPEPRNAGGLRNLE